MSSRTHFWLRMAGLGVIVLAELLPRIYHASHDAAPPRPPIVAQR